MGAGLESVRLSAGMTGDCCGSCAARCGAACVTAGEIVFAETGASGLVVFVFAVASSTGFSAGAGIVTSGFATLETLAAPSLEGNRIPQNPGEASVNSSSTYPLTLL